MEIVRVYQHERGPVFPTVERYFVVAPALALPKEHANVDQWWTQAFAAEAMQPAA